MYNIVEEKVFKTPDGKRFDTKDEAIRHLDKDFLANIMGCNTKEFMEGTCNYTDTDLYECAERLLLTGLINKEVLIELMNEQAEKIS